jgi:hypothetical protein
VDFTLPVLDRGFKIVCTIVVDLLDDLGGSGRGSRQRSSTRFLLVVELCLGWGGDLFVGYADVGDRKDWER